MNGSQAEGEIEQEQPAAKTQFSALLPSLPHLQLTPSFQSFDWSRRTFNCYFFLPSVYCAPRSLSPIMESQIPPPLGNSQRRRLTKKPPSAHHHTSSLSIDGRIDAQSLGRKRSSVSLRRAPSAPHARTPSSHASDSSSPRRTAALSTASSFASRSPTFPSSNEFAAPAPSKAQPSHQFLSQSQPRPTFAVRGDAPPLLPPTNAARPLSTKTSDELIGAPFDGTAILNRIEATKSLAHLPVHQQPLAPQHPAPPVQSAPPAPTPLPNSSSGPRAVMGPPPLPQAASFSTTASDRSSTGEKTMIPKMDNVSVSKRFSDESKESKAPGMLRKKSGFSGFMTSLVGSPKKPLISAPENPVHVTHVGYDSSTGQFTVRGHFAGAHCDASNTILGTTQGVAAAHQRERYHREGHKRTSPDPRRCLDLL